MAFGDFLFVSNTSYGSKIDEIREFLNKNYLIRFLYGFKKFSSQTGQRIETPVADKKIWKNLFTFCECSTYLSKNIA
jgi:hypothetical protein